MSTIANGLIAGLGVILASEIGDKTFIITAILAMKHSKRIVFLGAVSAATLMIILSAVIGLMSSLIPRSLTYYLSIFLFSFFGLQMLREGMAMDATEDEREEVEKEMTTRRRNSSVSLQNMSAMSRFVTKYLSLVFIETFTMNFFAEWGDRSQLSVIILSARDDKSTFGVITGAFLGHVACNALAVTGGQLIGQLISIRTITISGGVIFLLFALHSLLYS